MPLFKGCPGHLVYTLHRLCGKEVDALLDDTGHEV